MMSTTFLHLSDLHIRTNWPEQTGLVTDKLFKDLEQQCAKVSNLYLVFTGDYVFEAAVQSQYAHFREVFMRRLDSLGITKDRRISVPGNHDVSREALKSVTMALGAVRSYKSEEVFLSEYDHIAPLLFASKFSNYIENESAFSAFSCCQTNIGGHGWDLGTGVGIFCLNTALCSFAGIKDPSTGEKISDKGLLSINTRLIYQWLSQSTSTVKLLVMHHPLTWLSTWAKEELEAIIRDEFNLVLCGHEHRPEAGTHIEGVSTTASCLAPPLFTRKGGDLGYSFITIDDENSISIKYRQWTEKKRQFVLGTGFAGNDLGVVRLGAIQGTIPVVDFTVEPPENIPNTEEVLYKEFLEASTCCSSKQQFWVDRDFSEHPETERTEDQKAHTLDHLIDNLRDTIIRSPSQFGLSSVGRKLAVEVYKNLNSKTTLVVLDSCHIKAHSKGIDEAIEGRCKVMGIKSTEISGFILDRWGEAKNPLKILRVLKEKFPSVTIILLQGFDDFFEIRNPVIPENIGDYQMLYLRALDRTRMGVTLM